MKKIILGILILLLSPFVVHAQEAVTTIAAPVTKPVLYVREGCTHCAKVEGFMSKYGITDKVVVKETYNNETNTKELNDWFTKFNIPQGQGGVPFMVVDGKENYMGDTPIIEYLTSTFNITVTEDPVQTSTLDYIFMGVGGLFLFSVLGYGLFSVIKKK